MPAEEVAKLRNVAIGGQGGIGKTSVADALLFAAGAANRIGRVDDGSSAFDTEPEEIRRKSTITAALHHASWKKHELNVIDSPKPPATRGRYLETERKMREFAAATVIDFDELDLLLWSMKTGEILK